MFSEIQLVDIKLQNVFLAKIPFKFECQHSLLYFITECSLTLCRVFTVFNGKIGVSHQLHCECGTA